MIESLENNEVILLMYLADELPPVDRAEVTQMLASDANLRDELRELRAAYERSRQGLRQLDESSPLPGGSQAVAVANIMRVLRQRLANPPLAGADAPGKKKLRYPWWAYPAAAAAAILLAFLTWWGNHGGVPGDYGDRPLHMPYVRNFQDDPNLKLAEELESTFRTNDDPDSALLALRDDGPRLGDLRSEPDE